MPRVVNGLHGRLAHQARRADHAIEPRERDHLQDGRNASTFLADAFSPGTKELDLARRVAPVAELVLETLDANGITRAVRSHLRHQKAGQAGLDIGEYQPGIAHRRREKPFMADELIAADRKSVV